MAQLIPVWRDTIISYNTTNDYITYTIRKDDKIIYSGRAYRKPNTNNAEFKINRICENYLKQEINFTAMQIATDAVGKFTVSIDGTFYNNYYFFLNYSYTTSIIESNQLISLSHPINNKVSDLLATSVINTYDSQQMVYVDIYVNGEWENLYRESIPANSIQNKAYETYLFKNNKATKVRIAGVEYELVDECVEGELIYLNKYGGYDTVILNGRINIINNYDSYSYNRNYNNIFSYDFEMYKYLNIITKKYNGSIFWLNSSQVNELDNLFGSTQVYLNKDGNIIPVVVENKSLNYNVGKKLIKVDIEIKESQNKYRK